jgi:hypothetical protein
MHAFISITPQCGILVHYYATHPVTPPLIQLSAGERLPLPPLLPPPLRNLIQGMWASAPSRPSAAATGVHESLYNRKCVLLILTLLQRISFA